MRVDRLLYHLRFARSRSVAQDLAQSGHMRCNGVRIGKGSYCVEVGDVLTFVHGRTVRVIEIVHIPTRRGPASEAQACYRDLDASGQSALAARTA